ncbi:ester cyclase [Bradyrhizobium liaoningense]
MSRFAVGAVVGLAIISGALVPRAHAEAPSKQSTVETKVKDPKSVLAALGASVFAKKDFSKLDELVREDYIQHNPLVAQGIKGFREFFEAWFKAVPDFKYNLKKVVAEGDLVWAYGTYSGTQTGDWLGISATGKAYTFDAVDIFRVENGRLAEHWDVLDTYGLFKQLGVVK